MLHKHSWIIVGVCAVSGTSAYCVLIMEMCVGWVSSQAVFSVHYYFENFIIGDCSLVI